MALATFLKAIIGLSVLYNSTRCLYYVKLEIKVKAYISLGPKSLTTIKMKDFEDLL
jgi:hypothetical protein